MQVKTFAVHKNENFAVQEWHALLSHPSISNTYFCIGKANTSFVMAQAHFSQGKIQISSELVPFSGTAALETNAKLLDIFADKTGFVIAHQAGDFAIKATHVALDGKCVETATLSSYKHRVTSVTHWSDKFVLYDAGSGGLVCYQGKTETILNNFKLPWNTSFEVAHFDDHTLLLLHDYEAYLLDMDAMECVPYPLPMRMRKACFTRLGKYLVGFVANNMFVLNTFSREMAQYRTTIPELTFATALPKNDNGTYEFIVSGEKGIFHVSVPDIVFQLEVSNVAKEIAIAGAKGYQTHIHQAIQVAKIPQTVTNNLLLNWNFASASACNKVIQYLYTGEILVHAKSSDLNDVKQIADYLPLAALSQFCESLINGTDAALNEQLCKIASGKQSSFSIPYLGALSYCKAYIALIGEHEALALKHIDEALAANNNCIQYDKMKRQILRCKNAKPIGAHEKAFLDLVNNPLGSDCTLQVDENTISAHLYFLAKSPFFKEMLEMKETEVLEVNMGAILPDVDEESLIEMLTVLYSDIVVLEPSWDTNQLKMLLRAAKFFLHAELEQACEKRLVATVRVDNAKSMMEFASVNDCVGLRSKCQQLLATYPEMPQNVPFALKLYSSEESIQDYTRLMLQNIIMIGDCNFATDGMISVNAPFCGSNGEMLLNQHLRVSSTLSFKISVTIDMGDGFCDLSFGIKNGGDMSFGININHMCYKVYKEVYDIPYYKQHPVTIDMYAIPASQFYSTPIDNVENLHVIVTCVNKSGYQLCTKEFGRRAKYSISLAASNKYTSSASIIKAFQFDCMNSSATDWINELSQITFTSVNHVCEQHLASSVKANKETYCVSM